MKITKSFFYVFTGLMFFSLAQGPDAVAAPITLGIEPIIGYERVQKLQPTQHMTNRLMYGARITAGIPLVAAEAEVTRGDDTESFPAQDLTIRDTDDKVKLGLRSSLRLSSLLSFQARAGGQAKRNTHEVTTAGQTEKTVGAIVYKPYAGLGLTSRLGHLFALSGGVTVVFNDFPRMAGNEYQTTLGFNIKI